METTMRFYLSSLQSEHILFKKLSFTPIFLVSLSNAFNEFFINTEQTKTTARSQSRGVQRTPFSIRSPQCCAVYFYSLIFFRFVSLLPCFILFSSCASSGRVERRMKQKIWFWIHCIFYRFLFIVPLDIPDQTCPLSAKWLVMRCEMWWCNQR